MRSRVSTAIVKRPLKQKHRRATREGKSLTRTASLSVKEKRKLVEEGWGVFHVSPRMLKEALKGELFDP